MLRLNQIMNIIMGLFFGCAAVVAGMKTAGLIETTPDVRDAWNAAEFGLMGLIFLGLQTKLPIFTHRLFRFLWCLYVPLMLGAYTFVWFKTIGGSAIMTPQEVAVSAIQTMLALLGFWLCLRMDRLQPEAAA